MKKNVCAGFICDLLFISDHLKIGRNFVFGCVLVFVKSLTDDGFIKAPMRYKKNIVQGTVHRVFNASSNWHAFTESIAEVGCMLEKNQYPPQLYEPIIHETPNKIIEKHMKQDTNTKTPEKATKKRIPFVMQYRGNKSDVFSKRLRKTANISVIFTTRQMKTALPSLKLKTPENVRGNVVYEITCSRCQSSYVWQTTRHLATRVHKHS